MPKVLVLKKQSSRRPVPKEMQETENGLSAIAAEAEDLCAEIGDAEKVVDVAIGTLGNASETDDSDVGIGALRMIQYKLTLIQRSAGIIWAKAECSKKGR